MCDHSIGEVKAGRSFVQGPRLNKRIPLEVECAGINPCSNRENSSMEYLGDKMHRRQTNGSVPCIITFNLNFITGHNMNQNCV